MSLREIIERLHARRCGRGWIARCPAHEDRQPSLSIAQSCDGKLLMKCFAGCSYDAIRHALGDSPWPHTFTLPASPPTQTLDEAKRTEIAIGIWRDSRPAAGTLVDVYLRSRAITISPPASVRFHPNLKHSSGFFPAMVAAVQDRDGRIVAVHRTFLAQDGLAKADVEPNKMMLGPCAGGAVRFAKPAEMLALAEGIETALSVAQACPGLAVWATLSTSGLKTLQQPGEVREVIICADADVAGERAALAAAERFSRQGRQVRIARPSGANDFKDMLKGM